MLNSLPSNIRLINIRSGLLGSDSAASALQQESCQDSAMCEAKTDTKKHAGVSLTNPKASRTGIVHCPLGWSPQQEPIQAPGCWFFVLLYSQVPLPAPHGWLNHLCVAQGPEQEQNLSTPGAPPFFPVHAVQDAINSTVHFLLSNTHQNFTSFNEDIINACICQVTQTLTYIFALL